MSASLNDLISIEGLKQCIEDVERFKNSAVGKDPKPTLNVTLAVDEFEKLVRELLFFRLGHEAYHAARLADLAQALDPDRPAPTTLTPFYGERP